MIAAAKTGAFFLLFGLWFAGCTSQTELNEQFVQSAVKGDAQQLTVLLEKGVDIEALDQKYGATALMWAAHEGHPDIIKILLDSGAKIDSQQKIGCTALWYAAQQNRLAAAKILIANGADASIASHDGKTPLDIANELGNLEVAGLIKNTTTKD